jgi:hypothetical protein
MSNRTFTITLEERHIKTFLHFASMRRTLTESQRLIAEECDAHPDRVEANLDELEEIIPVIEAAQFAIRDGARK